MSEPDKIHINDKYSEAWYELGSPIYKPFLKYIIAVIQYSVDNFFFIKNTINAFQYARIQADGESYEKSEIWMAACTLGLHVISCILISIIDTYNKDALSGLKGKHLDYNHKRYTFFRLLAHVTLTMKLLRYTTGYFENRRANKHLHKFRQRRNPISEQEIQFVVDQNKNQLVESHYDLVESFFKTVPAALLQVFFMFQTNPDARLRLYTSTDQDRFATIFFTIITTSIGVVNYQLSYLTYKKALHFQDCFRSGFTHEINLNMPGDVCFVSAIIVQIATVGIRMCFYSMLLFWSPKQFVITLVILLLINWFLINKWGKTSWRFRAVLENPLYGVQWFCFDLIDLWINLFVPGVHYPKPLDHFLNFYTTTAIGVIVFQGFDFIFPTDTDRSPAFLSEENELFNSSVRSSFSKSLDFLNLTMEQDRNSSSTEFQMENGEDSTYFIHTIIKYLLIGHDYLTLYEMSYARFFYNVVKFMNIVNLVCLLHTFIMNLLKLYDLDFPLQITNSFLITILNSLNQPIIPGAGGLLIQKRKAETFLIFCMLPNAKFFNECRLFKKLSWKSIDEESLDLLAKSMVNQKLHNSSSSESTSIISRILKFIIQAYNFLSPVINPVRLREPKLEWDNIPKEIEEIKNSIKNLPLVLRIEMRQFIDLIYNDGNNDIKLLLGAFCSNHNEIIRHFTSLRIKKTFQLMETPVEKKEILLRRENNITAFMDSLPRSRENREKNHYEIGHLQRFIKEVKRAIGTDVLDA